MGALGLSSGVATGCRQGTPRIGRRLHRTVFETGHEGAGIWLYRAQSGALRAGCAAFGSLCSPRPLVVGDRPTIEDDSILFRAVVGDGVTVETRAVVIGAADDPIELRDGARVPAGSIITTQAQADALPTN